MLRSINNEKRYRSEKKKYIYEEYQLYQMLTKYVNVTNCLKKSF